MAAEVRRVADKGCFAVTFSENPVHLGHPSIHSGHWDPFFAACEDVGTVVNVHIGSSSKMVITSSDAPMDVLITLSPINIVQAAADFVWSKVPRQFPRLKYALSEGGIGWIPVLPRAHRLHVRPPPGWTGMDLEGRIPSQILDEQVICCWIDDPVGVEMRHRMNVDMICWECDYPHSDSTWPQSPERVMKQMQAAHVSDEEIDKISHGNAMRLYKLRPDLGARPRELHGRRAARTGRGLGRQHQGARHQGQRDRCRRPRQVREGRRLTPSATEACASVCTRAASDGRGPYVDNSARSSDNRNSTSSSPMLEMNGSHDARTRSTASSIRRRVSRDVELVVDVDARGTCAARTSRRARGPARLGDSAPMKTQRSSPTTCGTDRMYAGAAVGADRCEVPARSRTGPATVGPRPPCRAWRPRTPPTIVRS